MPLIILLRIKNVSFISGLTIKSTYLCLYLISISFNPWNFSGSVCNDFDKSLISMALTDISSVLVLNTSPFTPTISPIS